MKVHKLAALVMTIVMAFSTNTISGDKNAMKIRIIASGLTMTATLNDTQTAKDLAAKLPLRLRLNKHQNREYYASLKLSKNAKQEDGYSIGNIAYWPMGESLVVFYDKGYTSNLIVMGDITSGLEQLSKMGSTFEALIERIE